MGPRGTLNGSGIPPNNRGTAIHTAAVCGKIKCALMGPNHLPAVYKAGVLTAELWALLKSPVRNIAPVLFPPGGFRGGPLCPYAHSPSRRSYIRSASQYQAFRNRRIVRRRGGGEGARKRKSWETRKKRGIWRRNRPFGLFCGVPWVSAVVRCARPPIIQSHRPHMPPFLQMEGVSKPPKR